MFNRNKKCKQIQLRFKETSQFPDPHRELVVQVVDLDEDETYAYLPRNDVPMWLKEHNFKYVAGTQATYVQQGD